MEDVPFHAANRSKCREIDFFLQPDIFYVKWHDTIKNIAVKKPSAIRGNFRLQWSGNLSELDLALNLHFAILSFPVNICKDEIFTRAPPVSSLVQATTVIVETVIVESTVLVEQKTLTTQFYLLLVESPF